MKYPKDAESVEIPEEVEKIESGAFSYCSSLRDATRPTTLRKIGRGAFAGCASLDLEALVLPEDMAEVYGFIIASRSRGNAELVATLKRTSKQVFTAPSSLRVARGGSWYDDAKYCRSAYRDRFEPDYRSRNLGFRVLLVLSPED